jgi:hypothetical protein
MMLWLQLSEAKLDCGISRIEKLADSENNYARA